MFLGNKHKVQNVDKISMKASLKQAKEMLESNKDLSTEFKALFAMILSMMELLLTLAKTPQK